MSRDHPVKTFSAADLQIDYAGELNPQQLAAVTAEPGPALVIAGAGSGKTRTLTYRVAYLLEQGVAPDRILLLTFTNKAAREMMRRVTDLWDGNARDLWGGTFHSIGARILRLHADTLGYRTDFTILDREDATDLIKACMSEAPFPPADVHENEDEEPPTADVVGEIISMAANTRASIEEAAARLGARSARFARALADLARRYTERKRAGNVMDFDDLLVNWVDLMQNHPAMAELYQRRFEYVLVDEYQDTNKLQADLIDLMAARHRNVMVVGDDAQSIYSWRGADLRNVLNFPVRYPGTRIYKIESNYRSTPEILTLANAAIAPNVHQFSKVLTPSRRSGGKPIVVACGDPREEGAFIAHRIIELCEEGTSPGSIAVLYRSHFHALDLQMILGRARIPFTITSGVRFFEQAHIKDVTAHLKFILNPLDESALKRLMRMLPGIGDKAAEKLWNRYSAEISSAAVAAWDPEASAGAARPSLAAALQKCSGVVPKKALTAWAELTTTIFQIDVDSIRNKPSELIQKVLEAGYTDYLRANYSNHDVREEDLRHLAAFSLEFDGTEEFLTQLSLMTNVEAEGSQVGSDDEERVTLTTIHQSKGLEFDVVFLIMLCDGLFPTSRSLFSLDAVEEERRLFYVGITRARNELYLSYPLTRRTADRQTERTKKSTFLKELPTNLVFEYPLRSITSF